VKLFDVPAAMLLIPGGLDWVLCDLDPVSARADWPKSLANFACTTFGLAALYEVLRFRSIPRRWELSPARVVSGDPMQVGRESGRSVNESL
jgi:hypothetical protein